MPRRLRGEGLVVVIDDDVSMREALCGLLRSVGYAVRAYASAQDFLDQLLQSPPPSPACLVLDVRLPGLGGLDVQRELERLGVSLPIVFVSAHGDIPMAVSAIKAGAIEFLTKPFREQDLLDAVNGALERHWQLTSHRSEAEQLRTRYETLSARERQVMSMIAQGHRNKQIAAGLGVSEVTVKQHRQRLVRKMGATSLPALVRMHDQLQDGRDTGCNGTSSAQSQSALR